jgi:hypothetical protein
MALGSAVSFERGKRELVLQELECILESRYFRNAARSKQFLRYVVEHVLDHTEPLKERTIGVEVFERRRDYATGDDPVVRVQAGEVRRRLDQYYRALVTVPPVRIEIPVGSYVPQFHWGTTIEPAHLPSRIPFVEQQPPSRRVHAWKIAISVIVLVLVGIVAAIVIRKPAVQPSQFETFWAPVFTSPQQVLICIPSPVAYEFSANVYRRAGRAGQGHLEQNSIPLQLRADTRLKWGDAVPVVDFYVNKDDAYVAVDLSNLFTRIHKLSAVKMGRDFNYEDLRNSPSVLIGAYNNPLTMRMISDLPFVFRERDGVQWIEEQANPSHAWRAEAETRTGSKDFAIVARLLNSKTGQFLVIVGGIGMVGTEAAGRFVARQSDIEAALRAAPAGWQRKNLEMVLENDVIDGSPTSPRVVAVTAW